VLCDKEATGGQVVPINQAGNPRTGHGPEIAQEYADDYHRAIARLGDSMSRHRHEPWDRSMLLSAASAQAVARGHIEVAEALLNLDDDGIAKINRSVRLKLFIEAIGRRDHRQLLPARFNFAGSDGVRSAP
jgi:hypothetical protein